MPLAVDKRQLPHQRAIRPQRKTQDAFSPKDRRNGERKKLFIRMSFPAHDEMYYQSRTSRYGVTTGEAEKRTVNNALWRQDGHYEVQS